MHTFFLHIRGLLAILLPLIICTSQVFGQQHKSVEETEIVEAHMAFIDGIAAFENKEYPKALDLLTAAYVKLPEHPGVNYALADVYLQINDLENAEYYSKQAIKLEPQNKWHYLQLVQVYQTTGKTDAAIAELTSALEYHPDDKDLLFELAQTYTDSDMLEKANQIYNKLIKLDGETITIRLEKLKNFNRLNMRDSAIVELNKIRELDPDNLSTLQTLSNYYLELNKLEEAREVLKNALQINSTDPKTLIMVSDIYMSENKWDSVGITLGNVVADSSVGENTKLEIGRYLYSKFDSDRQNNDIRDAASTVFQKLIETGTESSQILDLAADFFTQTDQNEQALQTLERLTTLIPTDDTAWQQRLQLLMMEGNIDEAISVGEQAAQQIPQDPIILYFLSSAYLSSQEYTKAVESLTESSTLPTRIPLKAKIWGSLGDAYAGLEKWEIAFKNYEKSLELDSENPVILNNYAFYLSLLNQELSKAEEMALKAVEIDPENASFLDTAGWVYYQQGELKKAQKYIQSAIDTGKASAVVLEHMGDILNKLNKTTEAKKWWQKALEKDSTRTHLKDKLSE